MNSPDANWVIWEQNFSILLEELDLNAPVSFGVTIATWKDFSKQKRKEYALTNVTRIYNLRLEIGFLRCPKLTEYSMFIKGGTQVGRPQAQL